MRVSSSSIVRPPYSSRSRRPRTSRFTPFRTWTFTDETLLGDQRVESGANVGLGHLLVDVNMVVPQENKPQAALLVAKQCFPGASAVDAHRLRRERLLDRGGVATREPERREQAECARASVRELIPRRSFERVAERMAKVERTACALVVRVGEAQGGLVRRATAN